VELKKRSSILFQEGSKEKGGLAQTVVKKKNLENVWTGKEISGLTAFLAGYKIFRRASSSAKALYSFSCCIV
jgi:hypothetical protein